MFVKLHEWEMKEKAKKEGYEEGFESGREKGIQVGIQQGISEGSEQTKIETARNLLKYGDPIEKISVITGLSLEKVQQLQEEINNQN